MTPTPTSGGGGRRVLACGCCLSLVRSAAISLQSPIHQCPPHDREMSIVAPPPPLDVSPPSTHHIVGLRAGEAPRLESPLPSSFAFFSGGSSSFTWVVAVKHEECTGVPGGCPPPPPPSGVMIFLDEGGGLLSVDDAARSRRLLVMTAVTSSVLFLFDNDPLLPQMSRRLTHFG